MDNPAAIQAKWSAELDQADKKWAKFRKRADEIVKMYEDERDAIKDSFYDDSKMNLLWSNTETLRPALYSNTPTPEVMRRNKDRDSLGVTVSEVLERCLSYCLDSYDFDGMINMNVKDYVLTALGQAWVVYEPEIEEYEEEGETYEDLAAEYAKVEYVHYHDFLCNDARHWGEVRWVARVHYFTRKQLKEITPDWNKVPMDGTPEGIEEDTDTFGLFKKAKVFEIWDKDTKKVYYISKSHKDGPLKVTEPPVNLHGFFPCPRPLLGIHGKSIHPTPDYALYQDQVEEINSLTNRIYHLTKALRVAGVYDGKFAELQGLLDENRGNVMIAVDSWSEFASKGGIKGAVDFIPLDQIVVALKAAYEAREAAKSDLYEVTGLSDIVRGTSDPDETATAQAIKNQWGSLRIRDRQKEVQRYIRDLIRLKAEIIAEHFDVKTLSEMSGVRLLTAEQKQAYQMAAQLGQELPKDVQEAMNKPSWDDVVKLLRNDRLRSFSIDIETDSTMEPNETQEKQDRTEFLSAVGGFLSQMVEVVTAQPALAPLAGEMLTFGVRGFKAGRQLEETIEQTVEQMKQMASQPKQPDPVEMAKVENEKAKIQTEQQKVGVQAQEVQNDFQIDSEKNRLEAAKLTHDAIARDQDRVQREREAMVTQQNGFYQ